MRQIPRPSPCYLDRMIKLSRRGRPRWTSPERDALYEWDGLHGEIEVYNTRGRHLGALHAVTGEKIKDAQRGRRIDV